MAYPTFEQYNQAFQSHQNFILDAELKRGTVKKSGLGMPLAISGGFALTYTIDCGSKKYAVRCFHKYSKGLEDRYDAISKKLNTLHSKFFVTFEFQKNGIYVNGVNQPLVKMAWADGETLGEFLEKNYSKQNCLINLLKSFEELNIFLQKNNIAHGDLQLGNLMVSKDGSSIKLIDYDGLYVDTIKHLGSAELGHINFQHPLRSKENPFNAQLDNFSLITLWLGIKALIIDPSIWDLSQSDSDSLVFKYNDFEDPLSSKIISALRQIPQLTQYSENYIKVCSVNKFDQIPTLDNFIKNVGLLNISIPVVSKIKTRASIYKSQYPVLEALSYNKCKQYIGSQVEVIGKITEIKEGWTKNRLPYIFINFKDWRGESFKINIWKEGLDVISNTPDNSWVGKYISVKGLMEPIYRNNHFKYSCVSITVTKNDQITMLSETEAQRRLNYSSNVQFSDIPSNNFDRRLSRNQDKLQSILNKSKSKNSLSTQPLKTMNKPQSSNLSRNQELANLIKQKKSNPSPVSYQSTIQKKVHQNTTQNRTQHYSTKKNESNTASVLWVCFLIIFLIIFISK